MKSNAEFCLADSDFQSLLAGTDNPRMEQHLDHCQQCASRLEQLAADETFWKTSSHSLNEDLLDAPALDEIEVSVQLSPVLRAILSPSDDPHSLGRIGRFEICGIVGSGGMGTVLKARDVDIDRIVALKLPAAHLLELPSALERIEREARSAATIRHPNIIEIYQVDRWQGIPYLVMPYLPGPSLMSRLEQHGKLDVLDAIRIARQTAAALSAAHQHGVVHRDVKPGNILLGKGTEQAVLTDFGIAKIQDDVSMTNTGVIVGTPGFLSPEQARGSEAGPQSDLYSLGTVLWSMLTGEPPMQGLPTHTIVAAIARGEMPKLAQTDRDLPTWVYRLVDWLHALDPDDRPETAAQCETILRSCEQHLLDPVRCKLPSRLQNRRRLLPSLIGVLWLLIVVSFSLTGLPEWPVDEGLSSRATASQPADGNALAAPAEPPGNAVPVAIPQNSMSARLPQANMNDPSFAPANASIAGAGFSAVPMTSIRVDDDSQIEKLETSMRELDLEMNALSDELDRLRDNKTLTPTDENNDGN
ncbi:serine/threonine protein kinase with PASTA sensor(s) [Rhodopirellula maiorica SM1]|uniref:Serine/threonine protein kinase with PASTA sensor(S) n=1 Tax=Rhodopirellula maiorica SM1 TaxID=1265738 RepID=M5RUI4_9BACT|nr:serine/threonine-protein kinase [Rhodopirellula maiorica]EMI23003.1 serine/threonine protein kinase with PASTA sensor(s) [Rhodopirellula maiorica SM1]